MQPFIPPARPIAAMFAPPVMPMVQVRPELWNYRPQILSPKGGDNIPTLQCSNLSTYIYRHGIPTRAEDVLGYEQQDFRMLPNLNDAFVANESYEARNINPAVPAPVAAVPVAAPVAVDQPLAAVVHAPVPVAAAPAPVVPNAGEFFSSFYFLPIVN